MLLSKHITAWGDFWTTFKKRREEKKNTRKKTAGFCTQRVGHCALKCLHWGIKAQEVISWWLEPRRRGTGSQGVGVLAHARCIHMHSHIHTAHHVQTHTQWHTVVAEKPDHSFCWKTSLPLESNDQGSPAHRRLPGIEVSAWVTDVPKRACTGSLCSIHVGLRLETRARFCLEELPVPWRQAVGFPGFSGSDSLQ